MVPKAAPIAVNPYIKEMSRPVGKEEKYSVEIEDREDILEARKRINDQNAQHQPKTVTNKYGITKAAQ